MKREKIFLILADLPPNVDHLALLLHMHQVSSQGSHRLSLRSPEVQLSLKPGLFFVRKQYYNFYFQCATGISTSRNSEPKSSQCLEVFWFVPQIGALNDMSQGGKTIIQIIAQTKAPPPGGIELSRLCLTGRERVTLHYRRTNTNLCDNVTGITQTPCLYVQCDKPCTQKTFILCKF